MILKDKKWRVSGRRKYIMKIFWVSVRLLNYKNEKGIQALLDKEIYEKRETWIILHTLSWFKRRLRMCLFCYSCIKPDWFELFSELVSSKIEKTNTRFQNVQIGNTGH